MSQIFSAKTKPLLVLSLRRHFLALLTASLLTLAGASSRTASGQEVPHFVVNSTVGANNYGTCTDQNAPGATPDVTCTITAAFAQISTLNATTSTPTITFAPSLYGKTINMFDQIFTQGNFSLIGPGPGPNSITIFDYEDTQEIAGNNFLLDTTASTISISGFTFRGFMGVYYNGHANGGAVLSMPAQRATATLTNDAFQNNFSYGYGGAVYLPQGQVNVNGCSFSGNWAEPLPEVGLSRGGAIDAEVVMVTNSTFTGNYVTSLGDQVLLILDGGAIEAGTVSIQSSNFIGNHIDVGDSAMANPNYPNTPYLGGGAVHTNGDSEEVSNSYFQGNYINTNGAATANPHGGAICCGGSIANSIFVGNYITSPGAVVKAQVGAAQFYGSVTGSLFLNNGGTGVDLTGGALYGIDGPFNYDTFIGNAQLPGETCTTTCQGGAIFVDGYGSLSNDTIVNNGGSYMTGGGYYNSFTFGATYNPIYNTIISGNTGTPADEVNAVDSGGNYIDPSQTSACTVNCTPLLSPLGSYGGPVIGAPGATYDMQSLIPLPGSPLLAAGDLEQAGTTDVRGFPAKTTYNGLVHADVGSAEANYTLAFVQQPTRTQVDENISPAPTVQLYESGTTFGGVGGSLGISAAAATPSISSVAMTASGLESLNVSLPALETGDALIATVENANAMPTIVASTTSSFFDTYALALSFTNAPLSPQTEGARNSATITIQGSDGNPVMATGPVTLVVSGPNNYHESYGPTPADPNTGSVSFSTAGLSAPGTYAYTASSPISTSVTVTQQVLTPQQAEPTVFYTGSGSMATLDAFGYVTTPASNGGGLGAAVDANGDVWSLGNGSLWEFNQQGALANQYGSAELNGATALAIDGLGRSVITNNVGLVGVISLQGSPSYIASSGSTSALAGVSVDTSGNVWVTNPASNAVIELLGGAAPAAPLATSVANGTPGNRP